MYAELSGKVAVVTGAGAGIGRGIALRLAQEKVIVVINDVNAEAAQQVASEIGAAGGNAVAIPGDMTKETDVNKLFDTVQETYQRTDILVNNVGLFSYGDLVGSSIENWHRIMDLNVTSAFLCANRAAQEMRVAGSGNIVNVSSGAARIATTGATAYGVAKAAVLGLTRTLSAELAPNIRVNAVMPGIIDTGMDTAFVRQAAAAQGKTVDAFKQERRNIIPLKREGRPEDVAAAVAFLVSDQAAYMTGAAINLTGGLVVD